MSRNIPTPEDDWISLNIRLDDIERRMTSISDNALTSTGLTISEYDKLNKEQRATVRNASTGTNTTVTPDNPYVGPRPTPTPTPGSVPTIREFLVFPLTGIQGTNVERGFFATPLSITVTWDVINANTIKLTQTPLVRGEAVAYTLTGYMGIKSPILVSQETSFVLQATNSSGTVGSKEYKVECRVTDEPDPVTPDEPIDPEGLPIPTGLTGSANGKILYFEWTEVANSDRTGYQLYASQTTGFNPDTNPPTDLKKCICFGNRTFFTVAGAGQTWYARVRQVTRRGVSGLSTEASATST